MPYPDIFPSLLQILPYLQQQQQQTPSLLDIANQGTGTDLSGVDPLTLLRLGIPSVGGAGNIGQSVTPEQNDPYSILEQMLNNLQNQPLAQRQPSKLDSIINAIASGVSVLGSRDPSATLSQQLTQRSQQRQIENQALQNRQQFFDQFRLQLAGAKANRLASEQEQIRQENRQDIREQQKEERAFEYGGKALTRELKTRQDFEEKGKQIALDFQLKNRDFLSRIRRDEAIDRNYPEQQQRSRDLELIFAGLAPETDYSTIQRIARKFSGLDITEATPAESQLLNKFSKLYGETVGQQKKLGIEKTKAEIENIKAVTQATISGQRYQQRLPTTGNDPITAYKIGAARQAADDISKLESTQFYVSKKDPSIIIPNDQFTRLSLPQQFDYIPLSAEQNEQLKTKKKDELNKKLQEILNSPKGSTSPIGSPIATPDGARLKIIENIPQQILDGFAQMVQSGKYTDEQLQNTLKANNLTPEQIDALIGTPKTIDTTKSNPVSTPTQTPTKESDSFINTMRRAVTGVTPNQDIINKARNTLAFLERTLEQAIKDLQSFQARGVGQQVLLKQQNYIEDLKRRINDARNGVAQAEASFKGK